MSMNVSVNARPTYFREHPSIEIPKWLLAWGAEDISWGNDAAGRLRIGLGRGEWPCIEVFVDHEDREQRECSCDRYIVSLAADEDTREGLVETEDAVTAATAIDALVKRYMTAN